MQNKYMQFKANSFKVAQIISMALVIIAIILSITNPQRENNLPKSFITPIIAFEFIQNTQEVQHFFEVKNVMKYEQSLLLGNKIDYIFMLLYSFLLFCIAYGIKKITQAKPIYLVMFLCIVMFLSDALENQQIRHIIFYYKTASIITFLSYLSIFTWLKWSSIASSFLLISPYFLKGNWFHKLIGVLCIVCFILCICAFLYRGILNEIFAASVMLIFLMMIIFVFTYKESYRNN